MNGDSSVTEDGSIYYSAVAFPLGKDSFIGFIPTRKEEIISLETFIDIDVGVYEYFIDESMISELKDYLEQNKYRNVESGYADNGGNWIYCTFELSDQSIIHRICVLVMIKLEAESLMAKKLRGLFSFLLVSLIILY